MMSRIGKRTILKTTLLFVFVAVGSCKSSCKNTPTTSPVSAPFELTSNGGHGEMTLGVVAPTTGPCSDGRIIVASGNPQLLVRNLLSPGSGPFGAPRPATGPSQSSAGWTDNQIARLANGDLLLLWLGQTTAQLPGNTATS